MADITTITISELTPTNAAASDLIEVAQAETGSSTGYASRRTSLTSVANLVAGDIQYVDDLDTQDKTIIGAINELKAMIEALS